MAMIAITAVPDPRPVDEDAHVIPMDEFIETCRCGGFIDYDGFGRFSDGHYVPDYGHELSHWVYPSRVTKGTLVIPAWATHIDWYNR